MLQIFQRICKLSEIILPDSFKQIPFDEAIKIVTEIANVNLDSDSVPKPNETSDENKSNKPLTTQEYVANRLNRLVYFGLCADLNAALDIGNTLSVDLLEQVLEERFQILDAPNKKERAEKEATSKQKKEFNQEVKSGELFNKMGKTGVAHLPTQNRPTTLPENSPRSKEEAIQMAEARTSTGDQSKLN